ncbi:MAG: RsmB/NOP family class I SAM-dependent RNA methyltransferase, partial [Pseudobdellovibrio sp.]
MSSPTHNPLFETYFSKVYGERWNAIRTALAQPEKQVLRRNAFVEKVDTGGLVPCEFLKDCYWKPEGYKLEKNSEALYSFYVLDPASVFVARALEVQTGEKVLDLCAAPGGKSLILTEAAPELLISNEMSEGRRERLLRVFHEYAPKERRMCVTVKGLDGNQYGLRMPGEFDRVLADVPCSGERHLLENSSEFSLWSEKRTKNLAVRQYSLLSSAWLACKVGGRIVYSTCSISPLENDDVVEKLVKKRKPQVQRIAALDQIDFLETTEFGYQILPDKCGFGP